ncbi:hypothetical protein RB25_03210 [Herbaspirillum rubrisubalbicans]|jgi:hypothetical protein|uniref:DUF2442 domain-containing protein n=2 Tax=Herbaspirillum rubrisubalbicans TaxID=80842 RepID=A0AAD0XIJ2_9BURK|nr:MULTISPECIES: DUF2442 domain-containing protein [Herbaspirillum]ALU90594.1 Hypothetical protein Hrubri_3435 [Herbaspirillum rubrisubalbicans M1]AYR25625.1 DUF2442 domain-containing protein [Herbaspirillum rubrisubalbicans]MCP1573866.1 hypothetical protein [Herbaspirillum rubrisubalbicans]NQE48153.1 hypothetical protein [Herbaspirillum rubrisubalbicans]QJQ02359.1 DUF2442 domain-containing protein [Herbaspirillum rubrisubalbicans Os34]
MEWDVVEVKLSGDYALQVRFRDGVEGPVRFLPSFFRGVFAPLRDQRQFRQVCLVDGVVTWPGELDLAPDAMHDAIKRDGQWLLA